MIDVGGRVKKIRSLAERTWVTAQAVRSMGLVGSLHPARVASFFRDAGGRLGGPSGFLRLHAYNTPHKLALVDGDVRLSYGALDERINRLAHGLYALGVRPGERVAVMMRNRHEYLESQWAILRLGATCVQVGYRLKAPEVAYLLSNSRPRALLYQADYEDVVQSAQAEAGLPEPRALVGTGAAFEEIMSRGDGQRPPAVRGQARAGIMIYTSGTTGRPKGAERDFKNTYVEPVIDLIRHLGVNHQDRHLCVCPLYHSMAPAFVTLTYVCGGTVVLKDHFEPEDILKTIQRERITSSVMVPTMLGRLVGLPPALRSRYDSASLRWILSGAAPLPPETARRVEEHFGKVLFNLYGATETGLVTLALPGEHTARPGTIGRLLLGNRVRLLDDDGRDVRVGQPGEMFVKNAMLVAGYHRDGDATRRAMKDGYFSVGDVARVDEAGYYYICDRKNDMVISGGVNIYPLEIENHLHAHPAILECAVIGVPDPDWGEALKAYVVLREGLSLSDEEFRTYCKEVLADYKCPRQVEFVSALPRNPTGKVLKRELRRAH